MDQPKGLLTPVTSTLSTTTLHTGHSRSERNANHFRTQLLWKVWPQPVIAVAWERRGFRQMQHFMRSPLEGVVHGLVGGEDGEDGGLEGGTV